MRLVSWATSNWFAGAWGSAVRRTTNGGEFIRPPGSTRSAWLIAPAGPIIIPAPSEANGKIASSGFVRILAMGLPGSGLSWCAGDSSRFPAPSASIRYCAGRGLRAPDQSPPGKNTRDAMKCPCQGIASRLISSLFPIAFEALNFINTPPLMIARATGWRKSTRRGATQTAKISC